MDKGPYNPLDKLSLAKSIEAEVLNRDVERLDAVGAIVGAGVYIIYYRGDFPAYQPISVANSKCWERPIYVGKAIPKGGRRGGISRGVATAGTALAARLRKHAESIRATGNIRVEDFVFRYIVLDDIWIPLGENILIETFQPLWNVAVEGFGINDPGRGRQMQKRSPWDVMHPGRGYAARLTGGGPEASAVLGRIGDHFAGRPLRPLPMALAEVVEAAEEDRREV